MSLHKLWAQMLSFFGGQNCSSKKKKIPPLQVNFYFVYLLFKEYFFFQLFINQYQSIDNLFILILKLYFLNEIIFSVYFLFSNFFSLKYNDFSHIVYLIFTKSGVAVL